MPDGRTESAFLGWLDRHGAIVLKVARAYAHNAADVQDLTQDILLQLWRSAPRFERRAADATWIYRVALNTALGWSRQETRRRHRQRPLLEAPSVEPSPDPAQRETVERLYRAIHRLPVADVPLLLMYLDDLSYREISATLGLSEATVGVRLTRARKTLAALLCEESHGTRPS